MVALYHWHMHIHLMFACWCVLWVAHSNVCACASIQTDVPRCMYISDFCIQIVHSFYIIQSVVLMHKMHVVKQFLIDQWVYISDHLLHTHDVSPINTCENQFDSSSVKEYWPFAINPSTTVTSKSPKSVYHDIPGVRCSQGAFDCRTYCWQSNTWDISPLLPRQGTLQVIDETQPTP